MLKEAVGRASGPNPMRRGGKWAFQVMATFIPETDFDRAMSGEWLPAPPKPVPAEGVIKMRGLPFTATKQDIVLFFQGFGLSEDKVRSRRATARGKQFTQLGCAGDGQLRTRSPWPLSIQMGVTVLRSVPHHPASVP